MHLSVQSLTPLAESLSFRNNSASIHTILRIAGINRNFLSLLTTCIFLNVFQSFVLNSY